MAELAETKADEAPVTSDCCGVDAQAECCEPTDKAECCTPESSSCGCAEGEAGGEEIRDAVRSRYAAAATSVTEKSEAGEACCGASTGLTDEEAMIFGASLYDEDSQGELPDTATMASLGCGNPTAVAERLGDRRHALCLLALHVGVDDRLTTGIARRALGLRSELQIDGHLSTYIY